MKFKKSVENRISEFVERIWTCVTMYYRNTVRIK